MAGRDKQQSMGLWLNETLLFSPDKLEAAIEDLHGAGYGIVRVMLRNTNFTHRSPVTVSAVRRLAAAAHAHGMKIVLDCEPHPLPVGRDLGAQFPGAMYVRLARGEALTVNGRFEARIPVPNVSTGQADFLGVEAAFLVADGDDRQARRLEDLPCRVSYEEECYDTGFTVSELYYTEGRPRHGRHYARLTGSVADADGDGRRLVVYARFSDYRTVDFWSPECWRYYDELLECYRDVPLDGVGWDEPGFGGDWQGYHYGAAFAQAFARRHGYALGMKLHLLDSPRVDAETLTVRLHYYETLNEGLFEAQRRLFQKARELWGADLLLGTHHTWHGEGSQTDYRAGAVDYFRLNDNMDAGYTDCCWWDPPSVSYAYTLASSLARLTASGEAEVNTWHSKPTNSLTAYNARLMTLFDITWFNIWYGAAADTALFPAHYTWEETVSAMRRHRELARRLGRAVPSAEVAVWHGWEGVCAVNRNRVAGAHKSFCLNTAHLFMHRNVAFDWVDSRLLADATVSGGQLVTRLGAYRALVLPYAVALPRAAWATVWNFANNGGHVIFTGPPPAFDTDGRPLAAEFAALLELPPVTIDEYLRGIEAGARLPEYRAQRLDVTYPLADGERVTRSVEGEPHRVRNRRGNVQWLTDLDPRERLLDLLAPLTVPPARCCSETILWRHYRRAGRQFVVAVAREQRTLDGLLTVSGRTLEFTGGTVALVELGADGELTVSGDAGWREVFLATELH
ncbi:MAG: hypothetical protein LBK76_09270 [Verrucomicrobiales bacterium]|jgi:hypothetical protein|nr:hypothetical protein [Verrucomicrobiales bacterium]